MATLVLTAGANTATLTFPNANAATLATRIFRIAPKEPKPGGGVYTDLEWVNEIIRRYLNGVAEQGRRELAKDAFVIGADEEVIP